MIINKSKTNRNEAAGYQERSEHDKKPGQLARD
jgi:ribosomal protein S17E